MSAVRPSRDQRSAGVTLVELLAGLSAMVGIIASAYLCLSAGLESESAVHARSDCLQRARVGLALMEADLRHACTWNRRFEFAGLSRKLGEIEADNIDLTTHRWSPDGPGQGDVCEVSWFVDRDPRTGELGLWRRQDPTPDEEPTDGGTKEEIIRGIRGLRLEYFDGFTWYDRWGLSPDGDPLGAEQPLEPEPEPELEPEPGNDEDAWSTQPRSGGFLRGLPEAVRITLWLQTDEPKSDNGTPDRSPSMATSAEPTAPDDADGPVIDKRRTKKSANTAALASALAFQTVVRIELAGRAFASVGSGLGSSAAAEEPGESEDSSPDDASSDSSGGAPGGSSGGARRNAGRTRGAR